MDNFGSSYERSNDDLAKFLLRFTVGFLMLFHGIHKLGYGIAGIEGMLGNVGLPTFIAYGVYIGEILAPIMLIIGFRVKIAALLIIFTMIVAIGLAHMDDIFTLTKHGAWGIELQMFFILSSLAVLLQGAGSYSVDRS